MKIIFAVEKKEILDKLKLVVYIYSMNTPRYIHRDDFFIAQFSRVVYADLNSHLISVGAYALCCSIKGRSSK